MTLETLAPESDGNTEFDDAILDALGAGDYRFKVWGGDWCIDCQRQLPAFGAALAAAGVSEDRIEDFAVTNTPNGKEGPQVEAYGIELIPTVVVETAGGEEIARFVEEAEGSIAEYLANQLTDVEVSA